jgi:hypothetical protein
MTAVLAVVLFVMVSGYLGGTGARPPASIGLAKAYPNVGSCVGSPSNYYFESVSVVSTSNTVTTLVVGLKMSPTAGGVPVPLIVPGAGGACPATAGWYATLNTAGGSVLAYWTLGGNGIWTSTPTGTVAPSHAVAFAQGQSITFYLYNEGTAISGAFEVQAFGLAGETVTGDVIL